VVELGAQWIHGEAGNPLFDYAASRSLVDSGSVSYEAEGSFMTSDGARVDPELIEEARTLIRDAYSECNKFSRLDESRWGEPVPDSVGDFFKSRFFRRFDEADTLHRALFDWFML
jgi:hypothetical protein